MPTTTGGREPERLASPEVLRREHDRTARRRELFALYALYRVDGFDLMASIQTGDEPVALINQRLMQAGHPPDQLPKPSEFELGPEQYPDWRDALQQVPYNWSPPADDPDHENMPSSGPAPVTAVEASEGAAGRFSRTHGLPRHKAQRRSQTYEGRRERYLRTKAERLGLTYTAAELLTRRKHGRPDDWKAPS